MHRTFVPVPLVVFFVLLGGAPATAMVLQLPWLVHPRLSSTWRQSGTTINAKRLREHSTLPDYNLLCQDSPLTLLDSLGTAPSSRLVPFPFLSCAVSASLSLLLFFTSLLLYIYMCTTRINICRVPPLTTES